MPFTKGCMSRGGFTLLEMTFTVAIMTVVVGTLVGLSLGIGRAASVQRAKTTAAEEARSAMETLVARIRGASALSINTASLPGSVLRFRAAADTNSIGVAVDKSGRLTLGTQIVVQPDTADVNGDGQAATQLVMTQDNRTRVLCNSLPPPPAIPAGGGTLVGQGFWVQPRDGGLDITIQTQAKDNRGQLYPVSLTEFVMPRNP